MKTMSIRKQSVITLAAVSLIAPVVINPAFAQVAPEPTYESAQYSPMMDSLYSSSLQDSRHQVGSADLQQKVLMQINDRLSSGMLSPSDAAELKDKLNSINNRESWYRSMNTSIPASLVSADTAVLNQLSAKLQRPVRGEMPVRANRQADIDDLIAKALAHNKISSSQAEQYYLQLAQIESTLAQVQRRAGSSTTAVNDSDAALNQMKAQLAAMVK